MTPATAQPQRVSQRLSNQDASFLYIESQSGPMHVGSIGIFEGTISFERLLRSVEARMHLVPRLRQRLGFVPFNLAHPTLEDDPDFRIENHVKLHQLRPGSSDADMIRAAMDIFEVPFDRSRPLWEAHLFHGLEGNRSAILSTVHHCLIDGVSGVELTILLMDLSPEAPAIEPPEEAWQPAPFPTAAQRLSRAIFDRAEARLDSARSTVASLRDQNLFGRASSESATVARLVRRFARRTLAAPAWNAAPVTQKRSLAYYKCSFSDVRAIRAAMGCTVNDVVLTILSEAAARYMKEHDCDADGKILRIGCPVNVRREDETGTLGNRVSMMFPEVPAYPIDPAARLKLVAEATHEIKGAREAQTLDAFAAAADLVPPSLMGIASAVASTAMDTSSWLSGKAPALTRMIMPAVGINFIATNVPGVQVPLYTCGHRMLDTIGLLFLAGNLGYGVAIASYDQNLCFGLVADPHLMPDLELMRLLVAQVFEELKLCAAVPKQDAPRIQTRSPSRRTETSLEPELLKHG